MKKRIEPPSDANRKKLLRTMQVETSDYLLRFNKLNNTSYVFDKETLEFLGTLIVESVDRMIKENDPSRAVSDETLEIAVRSMVKLVDTAVGEARYLKVTQINTLIIDQSLKSICPLWPIC